MSFAPPGAVWFCPGAKVFASPGAVCCWPGVVPACPGAVLDFPPFVCAIAGKLNSATKSTKAVMRIIVFSIVFPWLPQPTPSFPQQVDELEVAPSNCVSLCFSPPRKNAHERSTRQSGNCCGDHFSACYQSASPATRPRAPARPVARVQPLRVEPIPRQQGRIRRLYEPEQQNPTSTISVGAAAISRSECANFSGAARSISGASLLTKRFIT